MKVDPTALRELAATCRGWSGELATISAPRPPGLASQTTTAAVAVVVCDAGLASAAFAERMQSTATNLLAGSTDYSSNDETSATRLTNLTVDL
ncbi:hypothetical protein BH09ACT7_BH09ACT7_55280 [soil metagenome]